jgi:DNA (cytosine-5)-methyltransferase 1
LDSGFEAAGCTVALRTDFDKHACATLRLNSDRAVIEAPVADVSEQDMRNSLGTALDGVDILIGGPPCQPFSKSAYWAKGDTLRLKDPRAATLWHYFRMVGILRPRAFLLENVSGLNFSGKEEGLRFILDCIREINRRHGTDYRPVWRVLNAAEYGVPQLRVRFILVAFRNGQGFRFPDPTHGAADGGGTLFDATRMPFASAWDAIGGLIPDPCERLDVGGRWAELLSSIPEGENYSWHTDRKGGLPLFGWRTRYWCFLLKLAKRLPSWTIQAQPGSAVGPFHWENRKLSWRELAALQTFPASFRVSGPRVEIHRQIGNAVPSLLAEALARAIVLQLSGKRFAEPCRLRVPPRSPLPGPEPTQPVPEKFLELSGYHAPHPGTGKGRAYQTGGWLAHAREKRHAPSELALVSG